MRTLLQLGFLAGTAGALLLSSTTPAEASHRIFACDEYCTSDCDLGPPDPKCVEAEGGSCELGANLTCDSTTPGPVQLFGGTDLDMNGFSITCGGAGCGSVGVQMFENASRLTNGDSDESTISGDFVTGVACGGFPGTEVNGITILDVLIGTTNCAKVKNNVIGRKSLTYFGANIGISTTGVANTDVTENNYIEDRVIAISVSGDRKVKVQNNVIHTSDSGLSAFDVTGSDVLARFWDNVILGIGQAFGPSPPVIFRFLDGGETAGALYDNNVCDKDHPDCIPCTADVAPSGDTRCVSFVSPFRP